MSFKLDCDLQSDGYTKVPVAASTKINEGCTVIWNGSGYAVEGGDGTLTCPEFIGIATATMDNSTGSAGDLYVTCIPPIESHSFTVTTFTGTSLAQAHCGLAYDVNAVASGTQEVDLTDTTFAAKAYGFVIEEVVTAGDEGTARGHFALQGAFD